MKCCGHPVPATSTPGRVACHRSAAGTSRIAAVSCPCRRIGRPISREGPVRLSGTKNRISRESAPRVPWSVGDSGGRKVHRLRDDLAPLSLRLRTAAGARRMTWQAGRVALSSARVMPRYAPPATTPLPRGRITKLPGERIRLAGNGVCGSRSVAATSTQDSPRQTADHGGAAIGDRWLTHVTGA